MSDLSDIIIPSGVVLLGAYVVKKYFDTWQPDTWAPVSKTCIGPICWSSYGPSSASPYLNGPTTPYTPGTNPGSPIQTIDCNQVSPLLWWVHPECWGTSAATLGW